MANTFHRPLPKGWRIGQFMFNFLEWLRTDKGYAGEVHEALSFCAHGDDECRMADPFHIPDEDWIRLMDEYKDHLHEQGWTS